MRFQLFFISLRMMINRFIFSRTRPANKMQIINNADDGNLLNVRESTLIRIIKEVGYGSKGSHSKSLALMENVGNNWNSTVQDIYIYKKKAYITFYVQYSNTDACTSVALSEFLGNTDFQGNFAYTDRYDNPQTVYFNYSLQAKAKVIKEILLTYIHKKYNI